MHLNSKENDFNAASEIERHCVGVRSTKFLANQSEKLKSVLLLNLVN